MIEAITLPLNAFIALCAIAIFGALVCMTLRWWWDILHRPTRGTKGP